MLASAYTASPNFKARSAHSISRLTPGSEAIATICDHGLFLCGWICRCHRLFPGTHFHRSCHRKSGAFGGLPTASELAGDYSKYRRYCWISACNRVWLSHCALRRFAISLDVVHHTGRNHWHGFSAAHPGVSQPRSPARDGALSRARTAEWCDHFGRWRQPSCNVSLWRHNLIDRDFCASMGLQREQSCERGSGQVGKVDQSRSTRCCGEFRGRRVLRQYVSQCVRFPKHADPTFSLVRCGYARHSPNQRKSLKFKPGKPSGSSRVHRSGTVSPARTNPLVAYLTAMRPGPARVESILRPFTHSKTEDACWRRFVSRVSFLSAVVEGSRQVAAKSTQLESCLPYESLVKLSDEGCLLSSLRPNIVPV